MAGLAQYTPVELDLSPYTERAEQAAAADVCAVIVALRELQDTLDMADEAWRAAYPIGYEDSPYAQPEQLDNARDRIREAIEELQGRAAWSDF